MRSGQPSKAQQTQIENLQSGLRRLERVGRMQPVPLSNLAAKSDLKTRGAQISFHVHSLEGIDHFVLVRNFSRDSGGAEVIKTWPAGSLKTTPQTFPIQMRHTDADPAIAGNVAYYWMKAIPVSTRTSKNIFLSGAQKFDASQQPAATQIAGDFAITQSYTPTTQPLTATSGIPVNGATINIASFLIQYPFDHDKDGVPDLVSYASGVITPLLDSTKYYVYYDDPTYAGGPQVYVASTSNPDVTAGLHRQFLGAITTPAHGGGGTGGGGGGGGPCFSGNTMIKTKHGWKAIGEIKVGDEVEALSGWRKVVAHLKHLYDGPMHRMGFGELVTPGHRIWNNSKWVPASELWPESVPFIGTVFNLHCDGVDDFECCYRLLNGRFAHNTSKL